MRLGLLGGTFDPPHVGHLLAASDAFEQLALDRLILIPAAVQPFKVGVVSATPAQRLAMVRLAVGDDSRYAVDSIEIDRKGLSYTVDTLEAYARRYGDAERFLLVGADVMPTFAKWRDPARIVRLARLVVLTRPGVAVVEVTDRGTGTSAMSAELGAPVEGDAVEWWRDVLVLNSRRVDVSSTEIRDRVQAGKSIRGFVPEGVADYIRDHGLYR